MIKRMLIILISIIILLSLLEIYVRIFHLNDKFSKNNCPVYEYNINLLKFRDLEHNIEKDNNTYRILVLGDSFAYGIAVPFEKIFPRLIEQNLNKNFNNAKIEVINCSQPGWNTEKEVNFCTEVFLPYKPNLVILSYVLNDTECLMHHKELTLNFWNKISFREPQFPLMKYLFVKSELIRYIYSRVESTRIKKEWLAGKFLFYREDNLCYKYFKRAVNKLSKLKTQNDFNVLVIIFPYFNVSLNGYPFIELHKQVKNIFAEVGFDVIDLYDYYKKYSSEELRACSLDAHPNELAHSIAATVIANYITKIKR